MVILTTLYNSENYIERCLASLRAQKYKAFICYVMDDLSTDRSVERARKAIGSDSRFVIIKNAEKRYQPGNYDRIIRENAAIADHEIIVEVDGDDWLPDPETLDRVRAVYSDTSVWIANGSFNFSDGRSGFSSEQKITSDLREHVFTASHIRTWRAFLWRNIKQEDLKDPNGHYWKVAGDLAFMYPMLEMAGQQHYRFMEDINYVYNEENPLNDHKVNLNLVNEVVSQIRKMTPYEKLHI
jgi:glycosyltransferase involved in cell wall biosynthesis